MAVRLSAMPHSRPPGMPVRLLFQDETLFGCPGRSDRVSANRSFASMSMAWPP